MGVDFLTRSECPLCDETLRLLQRAARKSRTAVRILDIDHSPDLLAEFDHRVPVIRDTSTGEVLAEGAMDEIDVSRVISSLS